MDHESNCLSQPSTLHAAAKYLYSGVFQRHHVDLNHNAVE